MALDLLVELKSFILVDLLGSELLFGASLVFILWIILSLARCPQKITLLVIAPALMTLAIFAWLPNWIWAMTAILVGIALSAVIFRLYYG